MEELIIALENSLQKICSKIGRITIGNKKQFPLGWRNAAKGRTVWRIIEEIVIQNLQVSANDFELSNVEFAESDMSIYDFICTQNANKIYVNIKSAVLGGNPNKDDISKPQGLKTFLEEDIKRNLFIATFFIKFNDDDEMSVEIDNVKVFPITWIPDIYVNPSNNGNLQSAKYKDIKDATKRTNDDFLKLLIREIDTAEMKKQEKKIKKEQEGN